MWTSRCPNSSHAMWVSLHPPHRHIAQPPHRRARLQQRLHSRRHTPVEQWRVFSLSLFPHPSISFSLPIPSAAMRIRRRPPCSSLTPFTSPPSSSAPLLQDPSLHLSTSFTPNGRDATASNGGGARWGKGAQELHQDGRPPKDSHGFAQDPNRRTPLHPHLPPPSPPRLVHSDEAKGRSIHCSTPTHLTDVGHGTVQDFEELPAAKVEEERGVLVDSKMSWDDAEQVNSNMRVNGSSGASILLEAARQLEAAAMAEKRTKRKGEWDARIDDHDYKSDERPKEMESGCGGAAASVRNNCTSVNGSDSDGRGNGDGPAAVMEEDKGRVAVVANGSSGRSSGKKRRSPAVLMEGSRCSRVNGRGWRCCQQTLVGYSLCEHHLGKGRLRSMSSVRGQIGATTRPKKNPKTTAAFSSSSMAQEEDDEEKQPVVLQQQQPQAVDDGDTATDIMEGGGDAGEENAVKKAKKKRKKMGMVKARSISSLLDGAVAAADGAIA